MRCDGVRAKHFGECEDCQCPNIISPVCGEDGRTYDNSCQANCYETLVVYEGRCKHVTVR